MERFLCLFSGSLILAAAFWFGSAIFRIMRAPGELLRRWKKLSPEDVRRCSLLWENFLQEELQLKLNKNDLRSNIPQLLHIFPRRVSRLQSYLVFGTPQRGLYCKGEYFYGFSFLLLCCFIGESLRISRGGRWKPCAAGLILELPGPGGKLFTVSPVEKLASIRDLSSPASKEVFEKYLLDLCPPSAAAAAEKEKNLIFPS